MAKAQTNCHKVQKRKQKIRILLVDDHPSVLNGIRSFLRTRRGYAVVGQALDGVEAVLRANELSPDIVIMDLSLPRMSGLEALRKIHAGVPGAKLIVYTMHEGREFVRAALQAGSTGYVRKGSSLRILVRAIDRVTCGEIFVDSQISKSETPNGSDHEDAGCETEIGERGKCRNYKLTEREQQVLKRLADGKVIKQIADELSVSFNTTAHHVMHIYRKLDVKTRGAAVAKALREELV